MLKDLAAQYYKQGYNCAESILFVPAMNIII